MIIYLINFSGFPSFFMTRFEPVNAASERAHHMLLYTCDGIVNDGTWDCRHHRVCGSGGPVRKEEGVISQMG